MANELVKNKPRKDNDPVSSTLLVRTNEFSTQLQNFASKTGLTFTEKEKTIVANALRVIDNVIRDVGLNWSHFDQAETRNNIISVLNQTVFLGLNPAATPREVYYIARRKKVTRNNEDTYVYMIEMGVEGAGNDAILRNFTNYDVKSYIVYDGDTFIPGRFDGFEEVLPKYEPKNLKYGEKRGKPLKAVYLVRDKRTGVVSSYVADREDVKQSLLAHIRQNGASESYVAYLSNYTIDQILEGSVEKKTTEVEKYEGKAKVKKQVNLTDLISPAWLSAVSREKMIERKLRNHAVRRIPKDFTNASINEMYNETFEDEKYTVEHKSNVLIDTDIVEKSQEDFEENANTINIPNVEIIDNELDESVEEPIAYGKQSPIIDVEETEEVEETELEDWML
jgi:hypothetical protein